MPLQLFIFDLAGTLIRDEGHTLRAYRRVLDPAGLAASDQWLLSHMGMPKRLVFAELLAENGRDPAAADTLAARFDEAIGMVFTESPPTPLPTAQAALAALERSGVKVAFNTGFARSTLDLIRRATGWTRFPSVASDEVAHGRPAPDMIREAMRLSGVSDARRVGVCGDAPSDLLAGTHAGCGAVVGVGHGTHSLEELRRHPHTHLIPDLSSIAQIADDASEAPFSGRTQENL